MVVANAVAALSEINEASPTGRPLIEMNAATINKLLTALNECTEWGQVFILDSLSNYTPKVANIYFFGKLGPKGQIILKWFFVSSISSKKRTKEFDFTTMIPQVDLFSFVFWKKLTTPKKHLITVRAPL